MSYTALHPHSIPLRIFTQFGSGGTMRIQIGRNNAERNQPDPQPLLWVCTPPTAHRHVGHANRHLINPRPTHTPRPLAIIVLSDSVHTHSGGGGGGSLRLTHTSHSYMVWIRIQKGPPFYYTGTDSGSDFRLLVFETEGNWSKNKVTFFLTLFLNTNFLITFILDVDHRHTLV